MGIAVGPGALVADLGTVVGPADPEDLVDDVVFPVDDVEDSGGAVAEEPQATITVSDRSPIRKMNRFGIRSHEIDMCQPPTKIFPMNGRFP